MNGIRWGEWLSAGDLVVDVGAHVGEYTQQFAAAVGPEGRVLAFEPDPDNAPRCVERCKDYPAVVVRPQAVGAASGRGSFYQSRTSTQSSRYVVNLSVPGREIEVDTVTLDDAVWGVAQGVKIDAQGDDGWVLAGARKTLRRMPRGAWVVFELWPAGLRTSGFVLMDLVQIFTGWRVVASGKSYQETTQALTDILREAHDWVNSRHTNVLLRKGT